MPALRPVKRRDFEAFLRIVGCTLKRTSGDHIIYHRSGLKRPIIITADNEIPVFIIRNNLRVLGLSVEQFLNILKQL